jgi:glycosyltransferase involved in cell wall biosynthesis
VRKTIVYIGNFSFPLGNAAGKRVYANGKILKELGYKVIFIGMSKELETFNSLGETEDEFDEFKYYNFPYPRRTLDWLRYRKVYKELIRFLKKEKIINEIGLVIFYGSPSLSLFISKLIKFCKKRKIKIISDCVDWLTIKTKNPLFDLIKWADNTYQKAYLNKKVDGVIVISSYLSNYYKKYNCKTVVIPPLSPFEYNNLGQQINSNNIKVLSYAGIPFRKGQKVTDLSILKDRIDKTIIFLHELKRKGINFVFNIYGFTKNEYLQAIPNQRLFIDQLGESVIFHGVKANNDVVKSIKNSDFTILIRDVNRDTLAGFPTKVSESISCGTPVITTNTSDLSNYIKENIYGFILDDDEEKALAKLRDILLLSSDEINSMKRECATSKMFLYINYINQMDNFLNNKVYINFTTNNT